VAYIGNDLQVAFSTYKNIDDISGSFDGVTTSFALLVNGAAPAPLPLNSNQCLISVGGVVQRPDDTGAEGFRLSGGNIIFSSAPNIAEDFFGVILAGADYVNAGANFPDGTLAAPSITFDQDNDTGYYRSGSGSVSFTSNGVAAGTWSSAGVTAPAFIPTSSSVPTNGVYLPAANSVGVATNGSGRLFITSAGNVGIGTTSPSKTLHVYSSAYTFPARVETNGTGSGIELKDGTTGANPPTVGAIGDSFYVTTNNNERFRVDSSGRLLVGTSATPTGSSGGSEAKFVIQGQLTNTSLGAYLSLQRGEAASSITDGEGLGNINFGDNVGNSFAVISGVADGTAGAGDYPGRLVFSTTADGASSPTERLRISNNGTFTGSATNDISDQRLKQNIQTITDAVEKVKALSGRTFEWKPEAKMQCGVKYGFIAQEVEAVVPELVECQTGIRMLDQDNNVVENPSEVDGPCEYAKSVQSSGVVPILVEALKEALEKIETLESKVAALEAQ
jgi:hypothetical protein